MRKSGRGLITKWGLQVVTGKGMLPCEDMNRHLYIKEEGGEEERGSEKRNRLAVEMDEINQ